MKVVSLALEGFRGFEEKITLEFPGRLTVLAGVNGSGKTSVLHALAVLLSKIPASLVNEVVGSRVREERRLWDSDVHVEAKEAFTEIVVATEAGEETWLEAQAARNGPRPPPGRDSYPQLLIKAALGSIEAGAPRLPLAVYYPARRPVRDHAIKRTKDKAPDPLAAFDGAFGIGTGSAFDGFFQWLREREDIENEQRVTVDDAFRDPHLEVVRRVIPSFLPGASQLRVQRTSGRVVVSLEGKVLSVSRLSDGQKSLLALAGDLARRLALANPGLADPLSAEAVVLIDEIELHLHPRWQGTVLESLARAFPACQFIVTTNSPIVLSTVPKESILLLDGFHRVDLAAPTRGRDVNAILAEVMGVEPRTKDVIERIAEVSACLDKDAFEEARARLAKLEDELGWSDAEVIRLKVQLDFLTMPLAGEP
jgi:predicted ATP-binding protein involved in virulence